MHYNVWTWVPSSVFSDDMMSLGSVWKNEFYWFQRGKIKGKKKGRRGTPTRLSWIMSSAYSDKWTLEWEGTPWNQIEYGLLWAGFMALGYPKPGSHILMQPKWGVSWGLLLWFVFCRCHSRTIQTASHCCQQGSLIEYTQTDVKGCDKSASVDRVAREGGKQPHICTQHEHHSGALTLTGWQAGWDQNTGLQVEYLWLCIGLSDNSHLIYEGSN